MLKYLFLLSFAILASLPVFGQVTKKSNQKLSYSYLTAEGTPIPLKNKDLFVKNPLKELNYGKIKPKISSADFTKIVKSFKGKNVIIVFGVAGLTYLYNEYENAN